MNDETIKKIEQMGIVLLNPELQQYRNLLEPAYRTCMDILQVLKTGRHFSAEELSAELTRIADQRTTQKEERFVARQNDRIRGIHPNTIRSYCRALQVAGFPIRSEAGRGKNGGFWIEPESLKRLTSRENMRFSQKTQP